VDVLGVHVSAIDMGTAIETIATWIERRDPQYVCVTGVHGVMECQRDPELLAIHNASGMTTPDGMPIVWAGKLARAPIDRVCGPELLPAVCRRGAEAGWRMFLYGGDTGVADRLAAELVGRYPGLRVVGTFTPPFRPLEPDEDASVRALIAESGADIVWVGLSTPKQERWMAAHVGGVGAPVLIGVGAAFDMHAGLVRRAPGWLRRTGFEWVYRLALEPRRLWRRYLSNNPRFVLALLRRRPRLVRG